MSNIWFTFSRFATGSEDTFVLGLSVDQLRVLLDKYMFSLYIMYTPENLDPDVLVTWV